MNLGKEHENYCDVPEFRRPEPYIKLESEVNASDWVWYGANHPAEFPLLPLGCCGGEYI